VSTGAAERAPGGGDPLDVALGAALGAGRILLAHLGRYRTGGALTKSSRRDLVTAADLASERHVVEILRRAFPDHAIEAEEETRDAADPSRPRWLLDPLDGTVNFVHELPCFAVSLALVIDGEPEVAVVHAPKLGETFTARRGGGAYLGEQRLSVAPTRDLAEAILATGFPYRRNELPSNNLDNFAAFFPDVRDLRRMGSAAVDLAWTAAGRFDGYWELHLSPHDVAAGALLVREAGGLVTDARGGVDWLRGGSIVAAGPRLHPLIQERLTA
jgi:myo-inositol-1(or 4)-monophosphatase